MKLTNWLDVERAYVHLENKLTKFMKGTIAFDPNRYYTRNEIDKKINTSIEDGDIDSFLQGGNVLHFLAHVFKKGLTTLSALIETTLTVQGAADFDTTVNVDGATTLNSGVTLTAGTASRPLKLDGSKVIITDKIDLASSNDITGTLPVGNGGTGTTSFTAGYFLIGDGSNPITELAPGVSGQIQLTVNTTIINYLDWASAPQSISVVTSVTITANNFTDGVRTT